MPENVALLFFEQRHSTWQGLRKMIWFHYKYRVMYGYSAHVNAVPESRLHSQR